MDTRLSNIHPFVNHIINNPDNNINNTFGENLHPELSYRLIRDLDELTIKYFVSKIFYEAKNENNTEKIKNLFILAFHIRWCKGWKQLT